jgi:anti-sigma-K factor RskA
VKPPASLKENILNLTHNEAYVPATENSSEEETPLRRIGIWKWIAAASVVLLIGSLIWNIQLRNQNNRLQSATVTNDSLEKQLAETRSAVEQLKAEFGPLQSPALKMASLKGMGAAPASHVNVFWDTTSKDVYLVIKNLPQPASEQQYQLWALINKQPVDLGVFDVHQEKLMLKMKNVQNAQAFAITLEPKGGSTAPTLQNMYVYGKL